MATTTSRGYRKPVDADDRADALTVDLAATMDLLDADVTAALAGVRQLTNPGFEVWQRGNGAFTADLAYTADRWYFTKGGTSTVSITPETTVVDVGSGKSLKAVYVQGTAVSAIVQKIENVLEFRGRTVTFAIRVRKGASSSVRPYVSDSSGTTYGATSATTGAFETLSVTRAIGAGVTSLFVAVELGVSDTVYLDSATLGIGTVALPYAPLHPAEDLARCLRYYEVHGGVAGTHPILQGYNAAATASAIGVGFAARKAITPTMTKNGTWTVTNCSQPAASNPSPGGYDFNTTVTATAAFSVFPADATCTIVAEANP